MVKVLGANKLKYMENLFPFDLGKPFNQNEMQVYMQNLFATDLLQRHFTKTNINPLISKSNSMLLGINVKQASVTDLWFNFNAGRDDQAFEFHAIDPSLYGSKNSLSLKLNFSNISNKAPLALTTRISDFYNPKEKNILRYLAKLDWKKKANIQGSNETFDLLQGEFYYGAHLHRPFRFRPVLALGYQYSQYSFSNTEKKYHFLALRYEYSNRQKLIYRQNLKMISFNYKYLLKQPSDTQDMDKHNINIHFKWYYKLFSQYYLVLHTTYQNNNNNIYQELATTINDAYLNNSSDAFTQSIILQYRMGFFSSGVLYTYISLTEPIKEQNHYVGPHVYFQFLNISSQNTLVINLANPNDIIWRSKIQFYL